MGKSGQRRNERMITQATDKALLEQKDLRTKAEGMAAAQKKEYREFNFSNPFEDLEVNTQSADYQREMGDQSRANILGQLKGVAGGSGVAGLAQSLANQGTMQSRQISLSLGQQEQQNQMMSKQGEQMVQSAKAGKVSTMYAAELGNLAGARAGEQSAYANQMAGLGAISEMESARMGASGDIIGGVATAAASVKVAMLCVPKGVHIDMVGNSIAIENIKPGDIVIGYNGNPVKVLQKHEYLEDPTQKRFYKVKFDNGSIVDVCDMHRIKGERSKDITENVVSKEVYGGVELSYDLLTEDLGYRISNIPVNSMIEEIAALAVKLKNK